MGVKLSDLITPHKVNISDLAGIIITIDAPNIIMGLFNFARKNPDGTYAELILDRTQRPISHLYGLLYRVNFYYSKKIFPIFCFDGKESELKKLITKDQLKDFLFTQRWYEFALKSKNKELARKIALSKEYLWQNVIQESKQLLNALGVPYIDSPASAESQCAQLVKDKIAHYSNSQDFDSLVFGCPHLIQNLTKSLRRKVQGKWIYQKVIPYEINLTETLHSLEIDQFQLIDMAILIGCDYFPGIKGIGPKKALKLIKQFNSLERVIAHEKEKYSFESLTSELIAQVRKLFIFPDILNSYSEIVWNMPNESIVNSFLCEQHFLDKERIDTNLKKLSSNYEKCRAYFIARKDKTRIIQNTIDRYFL
ncbi:MAG: 5'-3' exonuclease H3TH domain-containing protein [Promethearchaeota archaeon]